MKIRHLLFYTGLLVLVSAESVLPQYFFFGRNKVQFETFDWKVIRTEHFDIYYYNEMEEIAETGAYIAEQAYDEYKVIFNHVVLSRIPLIFYNTSLHFQQTNTTPGFIPEGVGGFFEFIKGRVVIPYTGSLNDFTHVIRHELVHVFMTTKVSRILADHRMPTGALPPLWYVEGIAEFYSTKVDAQAEMVMRDAIINNYFFGLKDIYQIYGSFLMYKEGQSFLEYVAEVHGREKVMLMMENFWMFTDFEKVIEHTLGKTIEEIDREWLFYLKRKYYPLLIDKAPPQFAAEKLTDFGFNFSPVYYRIEDKEFLYFSGNRDGYSSLYRVQINTGNDEEEPELVLRGEKTEELEAFHLFQSGIDISPDGMLAFVTKSGPTDAIHIYSITEDKIIRSFKRNFIINISSPKFSGDGSRIVFSAVDQKGFSDLFILEIKEDSIIRLTNDIYDDKDPVFGFTDRQVLFSSDRTTGEYEKKYNIFSYDLNKFRIDYVTYLNANTYAPVFAPDKNSVLVSTELDGVRNIWQIPAEKENISDSLRQITFFITNAFSPSFINEFSIAFTGFENFAFNLYKFEIPDTGKAAYTVMDKPASGEPWRPSHLTTYSEREEVRYKKEYTLDYAQSQISTDPIYGTRGGAVLSLSDLFGDDNYFFLIYNTADSQSEFLKSFNVAVQRINLSGRANYGYGIFNFSGRRYDIRDSDEFYFERSFGGFFLMHFPLSKFQRIEAAVSLANSDKQVIEGVVERKALLVSNTLSYVIDNSLWAPTGPVDGTRARLLLGYTGDVKFSNVNYFTVIADFRHYLRLTFRSALAFRSALFYNEGKEARRYFAGGSWDLRGWPRWSVRGEKLWLSSLEYRFPLIDEISLKFPFLNLGFFGLRGALFADAGGAWDTEYRTTLGSVGGGIRLNLFGAIVLRYDIGKKIENNLKTFQPGLFYQFFFGWDF